MLRARARSTSTVHCPYCRDDLVGEVLACGACETTFHTECVEEGLTECPTLGCGARLKPSILDQPPVVFEAPKPPAWFWPAATVAFLLVGYAALHTSEAIDHWTYGKIGLLFAGRLYVAVGMIGIANMLWDRGWPIRLAR